MFVILVYDVGVKRVNKILKTSRKYLNWVQNSVLEGDISEVNFKKLKTELLMLMDTAEDSIIFYTFRTKSYSKREEYGLKKGGEDIFL
ncbi:CRISPR-associated endonuclease Cas2 [Aneurinibacillus terranovensis]|uniref:CRISPR-associated endonuclease Cas2 n=1 Tax=Aneurinibacillus terranovensis TaxID=278991 RepID=UPI00042A8E3F|nr:CRISPR-associated endonuclease Cas2 [Aneurinibacillus terranovensis]